MAELVHWKKEKESVECSTFEPLLDNLEGEK